MTVWETNCGVTLCEIAYSVLCKLGSKLDKAEPVQYAEMMPACEALEYIKYEVNEGSKFITCQTINGESVVVMERQNNKEEK